MRLSSPPPSLHPPFPAPRVPPPPFSLFRLSFRAPQEIKLGVKYILNGQELTEMPGSLKDYQDVVVEYEVLPGWTEDISRARNFTELPKAAQDYVLRIEELLKVKIRWIGTGGDRIDMIER